MTSDGLPQPSEILPHRPPFLFVDSLRVLVPGERVEGTWNLTGDEWFFGGHFPGRPTLPGVLMLEALAQLGACAVLSDQRYRGRLPLFGGADKVRFRRQVVPGDRLDLAVEMERLGSRAGRGSGVARLGDDVAAQATLTFVLVDS